MSSTSAGAAPLGVGILGCGNIAPMHAEALGGLGRRAQLLAVADERPERADALAARYSVRACPSLSELLAVPGVELVCVCTPSGTHGAVGAEIARAGRHVVLEKPIDTTLGAADDVIRACEQAGVVLSVISQHRFDGGVVALRDALRFGALGKVVLTEARVWWHRSQSYYDADAWRGTYALDGGALMNQGVHLVDLLLHLNGPLQAAFARAATVAHRMEAEDLLVANLAFANGTLGALAVTTASFPGLPESLAVTGTEGSVVLEAGAVLSWHLAVPSPEARPAASASRGSRGLDVGAHRAQLADVVAAVADGRPPAVSGEDGRAALAAVLACYESCRTGQDVRLG
jgi:UDP-N-acetyl-2-amino-2-deoxyglucuronate dehydrogenase